MAFGKKKKKEKKNNVSIEEYHAGLPDKKRDKPPKLTGTERRLQALEKRNNPVYNKPFEPYSDPAETDEDTVKNARYEKIADRVRLLKWFMVIVLLAYLLFMAVTFRDQITMENFRYLIRSVDLDIRSGIELDNSIVYDADPDNIFIKYRDYLAVIGSGKLKIVDGSGREAYTESLSMSSPAIVTSSKYMLVYDRTGGGYSVYSYFTKEHSEDFGYPVCAAAVSDSGVYAVCAPSGEYEGVVYVYSQSFKLMSRVFKNKRVSALALNRSGDEVMIAACGTDQSGLPVTEITVIPTGSGSSRLLFDVEGAVPYECGYIGDEGFYLVSNDGIRIYGIEGDERKFMPFTELSPEKYSASEDGFTLVSADRVESGKTVYHVFDEKGGKLYSFNAGHGVIDDARSGDALYILYGDRAVRVSGGKVTDTYGIPAHVSVRRIIADGDRLLICTETSVIEYGVTDG